MTSHRDLQGNVADQFALALSLLRRIEQIMSDEGENNWIRGIRSLIALLEEADDSTTSKNAAWAASVTGYDTMVRANGGFGDYVIWRDNFDSRIAVNEELDMLRAELLQLFHE